MVRYRTGLLVVAAVAVNLILAACGGTEPTPIQLDTPTPAEQGDQAGLQATGGVAAGGIDADVIVATQEQVLVRLYQTLLPSVVHIRVAQRVDTGQNSPSLPRIPGIPLPDFPQEFFEQGEGSGFVWDDQGHIVTNNHVVEGADRVTVVFADRAEVEARVIGADPDSDLAVLELVEPKGDAVPVALGDSDALKVGQMAVAIGNPFGQEFTMTTGIVSALGRTIRSGSSPFSIPEVVQTDAPINPGNSGGPLLDRHGRVIGVNTQILSRSGVNSGVSFSVPINTAKRVIPALIEDGLYEYSWLGITGSTLRPVAAERMDLPRDTQGALVIDVAEDSPADQAGLRGSDESFTLDGVEYPTGGDVIVAIIGVPVRDMDDLIAFLVSKTRPGDTVPMEVMREGQERETLEVTLGKRPNAGQ